MTYVDQPPPPQKKTTPCACYARRSPAAALFYDGITRETSDTAVCCATCPGIQASDAAVHLRHGIDQRVRRQTIMPPIGAAWNRWALACIKKSPCGNERKTAGNSILDPSSKHSTQYVHISTVHTLARQLINISFGCSELWYHCSYGLQKSLNKPNRRRRHSLKIIAQRCEQWQATSCITAKYMQQISRFQQLQQQALHEHRSVWKHAVASVKRRYNNYKIYLSHRQEVIGCHLTKQNSQHVRSKMNPGGGNSLGASRHSARHRSCSCHM